MPQAPAPAQPTGNLPPLMPPPVVAATGQPNLPPLPPPMEGEKGKGIHHKSMLGFRNKDLLIAEKDKISSRRNRLITLAAMPFLIALVALYLVPFLIDWDQQKKTLQDQVLAMTGRELKVDGSIDFTAFPLPNFTIHGARLANPPSASTDSMISVQTLQAKPSIFALLFGKIRISEMFLTDVVIELENFEDGKPNWDFKSSRSVADVYAGNETLEHYTGIKHVTIKSGKLYFRTGKKNAPRERMLEISDVDILMDSFSGPYSIKGGLESSLLNYGFEMLTGNLSQDGADIDFTLRAGTSNLTFKGKANNWATSPSVEGKMAASIDRSIESMTDYFGIDKTILPSGISSIFSTKTTDVKGDMLLNASGFNLTNVSINAVNTKGAGDVNAVFGDEYTTVTFKLNFENVDLDQLMEGQFKSDEEAAEQPLPTMNQQQLVQQEIKDIKLEERNAKFDLASSLKLVFNVNVNKAKFKSQEISALHVDAELGQGQTLIKQLTAKDLPGNSAVEISGTLSKAQDGDEKAVQKFESKTRVYGDQLLPVLRWLGMELKDFKEDMLRNYNFQAEMTLMPDKIEVHKISGEVDETFLLGQALIQKGDNPATTSAFKINRINLDKYMKEPPKTKSDFFSKPYLESDVVKEQNQVDAFLRWPTGYFKNFGASVDIDEVIYHGDSFKNIAAVLVMKPSIMEVKKLAFDSFTGPIQASGLISTKNLTPYIEADIKADRFNFRFLREFSAEALKEESPRDPLTWSAEPFFLSRLGIATMKLTGTFKQLDIGRLPFKDVTLAASSDGKEIKVETFKGALFQGVADGSASIGIDRPNVGIALSVNNADMPEAIKTTTGIEILKQGRFSTSIGLSSNGSTEAELVNKLSGSGSITARGVEFEGIDIGKIFQEEGSIKKIEDLRKFLAYHTATGTTTLDYLASNLEVKSGVITPQNTVVTHYALMDFLTNSTIDLNQWKLDTTSTFFLNIRNAIPIDGSYGTPMVFTGSGLLGSISGTWDYHVLIDQWEKSFYKN